MSVSLSGLKKKSDSPLYRLIALVIVAAVIVLIWAWWYFIYANPTNVFNGMISNSLSTSSFAKVITQTSDGQNLYQYNIVETGSSYRAEAITKLDTPAQQTFITTKSIGTPTADYEEYTHISTGVKLSDKSTPKFGPAIGVWGYSTDGTTTDGQLFNSGVLGYLPIGDLSVAQKAKLISFIKKNQVYTISKDVKKKTVDGRPRYTYQVSMKTVPYVEMIKQFGTDLGLNQLASVNNQSLGSGVIKFNFTVDVLSRQLTSITSPTSNRVETYSGYGAKLSIPIPKKTIPIDQLEELLQSLN